VTGLSSLVLAAHGTRDPAGIAELERLASLVALRLPGVAVRVGYVDVLGPSVSAVLSEVEGPVTLVPLFLASGYHVRADIPAAVAQAGRRDLTVTSPLGPDAVLVDVALDRLRAAGAHLPPLPADALPADAVVLAAAGSADPRAVADVRSAARQLGAPAGFIATSSPSVADVVGSVRARRGAGRVAIASWLLAPGFFHTQLASAGADIVAEPLGAHPAVADLIVSRATAPLLAACGPAGP
jgi:sirohydrochlorin ferrochelatase